jgi:hypothetical protein
MEDKESLWLKSKEINLDKDAEHDAAGINDDWPIGRGVFIHDQKNFVILVNFEDHLQIIILPENREDTIKEGL